jgi:hypothetical protein
MSDEDADIGIWEFWRRRNEGVTLFVDRLVPYNLAVAVSYGSARAGLTPMQVSLAGGMFALAAFLFGITLPLDQALAPILLIYGVSQLSEIFYCANSQLARMTNAVSKFGYFFGKSIDIAAFILLFGGFFAYLHRYFMAVGDSDAAVRWLLLGYFFLLARVSRFSVWQRFEAEKATAGAATRDGRIVTVLKNLMDMQVSLFGMLLFPFAPGASYALFAMQAVILAAVYVRYFFRGRDLFGD